MPEPDGEQQATPEDSADPARRVMVLAFLVVSGSSFILSLLFFGERANTLVAVLALLLAFVLGIASYFNRGEMRAAWISLSPGARVRYMVGMMVSSGAIATSLFALAGVGQVEVESTEAFSVEGADELSTTTPASIVFPGPTPERENLGLRLHLDNPTGSGDCTTWPSLVLIPSIGDRNLTAIRAPTPGNHFREAEEVTISLGGSVQDLHVEVEYQGPAGCTVSLQVREAVFYG